MQPAPPSMLTLNSPLACGLWVSLLISTLLPHTTCLLCSIPVIPGFAIPSFQSSQSSFFCYQILGGLSPGLLRCILIFHHGGAPWGWPVGWCLGRSFGPRCGAMICPLQLTRGP